MNHSYIYSSLLNYSSSPSYSHTYYLDVCFSYLFTLHLLPCFHVYHWPMLLCQSYSVSLKISQSSKMEHRVLLFPSKIQNKEQKKTMVWVLLSKDHGKTNHVTRNVTHGKVPFMVIFIRDTCMKSKKLKKQSKESLKNITRQ